MKRAHLSDKINVKKKLLALRIKQIVSVLFFGLPVAIWLTLRDRRTMYFLPHVGLGDYCIALGYLENYKKYHNLESVTLIIPPNRKEVAGFYPHWDALLVLPMPFYLGIAYLGSLPGGMAVLKRFPRIVSITYTLYSSKQLLSENPDAKADDLVKLILSLPDKFQRAAPIVPMTNVEAIVKEHKLKEGKTVLLNPYTGGCAVKEIYPSFYQKLAARLHKEGYAVATILGSREQRPLDGTEGILASLSQAWHLARWCGWVVGTRSGFFDFIQPCGCNLIALDDGTYKQRETFLLPKTDGAVVKECIWSEENEHELVDMILLDIKSQEK